jgi:hypothetical protein
MANPTSSANSNRNPPWKIGTYKGLSGPHMQQPATAMGEAVEELLMILITARQ